MYCQFELHVICVACSRHLLADSLFTVKVVHSSNLSVYRFYNCIFRTSIPKHRAIANESKVPVSTHFDSSSPSKIYHLQNLQRTTLSKTALIFHSLFRIIGIKANLPHTWSVWGGGGISCLLNIPLSSIIINAFSLTKIQNRLLPRKHSAVFIFHPSSFNIKR